MADTQLVSKYTEFMRTVSLSQRMKDAKADVRNLKTELSRFSTESPVILPAKSQADVAEIQTQLNAAQAHYGRLVRAYKARRSYAVSYEDQVARIMAMPGVVSMAINGPVINIIVSPRYWYFGKCYDLGDWIIIIDNTDGSFDTNEKRSGFRDDWPHGQEPGFCLEYGKNEPHHFCFGSNFVTIDHFVDANRIVEAVSIAIACMHTIDESDEPNLVLTYETVR